jgi:hypothetical protein
MSEAILLHLFLTAWHMGGQLLDNDALFKIIDMPSIGTLMDKEPTLDTRTQAGQLLGLTQAMQAAAKADDWDEFELQEQQRSAMLTMVFSGQALDGPMVNVIKEIQLIDKTITALISQKRDQAAEELRHFKYAREGSKAYQVAADEPYKPASA